MLFKVCKRLMSCIFKIWAVFDIFYSSIESEINSSRYILNARCRCTWTLWGNEKKEGVLYVREGLPEGQVALLVEVPV